MEGWHDGIGGGGGSQSGMEGWHDGRGGGGGGRGRGGEG